MLGLLKAYLGWSIETLVSKLIVFHYIQLLKLTYFLLQKLFLCVLKLKCKKIHIHETSNLLFDRTKRKTYLHSSLILISSKSYFTLALNSFAD